MNNNEKSPDSIAEEVLKEWERFKINSNEEVPDINAKEVLELLDEISTKVRHEYFGIESVKGINNFCEALKNCQKISQLPLLEPRRIKKSPKNFPVVSIRTTNALVLIRF